MVHHEPQVGEGAHLLEAEVEAVLELVLPGEVVHGALVEILKVGDIDGGAAVVTRSSPAHLDIELTQGRHPCVVTKLTCQANMLYQSHTAVVAITWPERDAIDHSKTGDRDNKSQETNKALHFLCRHQISSYFTFRHSTAQRLICL